MINRIISYILKLVIKQYKKYKRLRQNLLYGKYMVYDDSVNIDGLKLDIRKTTDRKFITIGSNSLIGGSFIFEKETGAINIGERTSIGASTFMCIDEIDIGNDVMISWGCTFVDNNSHSILSSERKNDVLDWKKGVDEYTIGIYKDWSKVKHNKITVNDKAWIGFNCIILKGVTIGEGAIIAAGSVVTKDVPPYVLAGGNPSKVLKSLPQ